MVTPEIVLQKAVLLTLTTNGNVLARFGKHLLDINKTRSNSIWVRSGYGYAETRLRVIFWFRISCRPFFHRSSKRSQRFAPTHAMLKHRFSGNYCRLLERCACSSRHRLKLSVADKKTHTHKQPRFMSLFSIRQGS